MKFTWEWTTVIPEDHPMAPFVNGLVTLADKHEPRPFKSRGMYRRRVLIWRGRWHLVKEPDRTTTTTGGPDG